MYYKSVFFIFLQVKWSVYIAYLKAVGPLAILLYVLMCLLSNGTMMFSNVWLSSWSEDKTTGNATIDNNLRNWRLEIYGVMGIGYGKCLVCCIQFANIGISKQNT